MTTAADGQRRCLPPQIDSVFFADAACTSPIAGATALPGCTIAPTLPPEVTYATHAYPVGDVAAPTLLYTKPAAGDCAVLGAPPSGGS